MNSLSMLKLDVYGLLQLPLDERLSVIEYIITQNNQDISDLES